MPKQKTQKKVAETRRSAVRTQSRSPFVATLPKVTATQYLARMMRRTMNVVNTKITKLEERVATLSSSSSSSGSHTGRGTASLQVPMQFETLPAPSAPVYLMPRAPAEKPRFPVKNKHPVTFIEDLTTYLKKGASGADDVIDTILECLEGESRNWARIYKDRWTHFEDFKTDFLDTYWGEAEQNDLRRKIVMNSWDSTQSTMLGHFITLCGQAKMLTYAIQEKQLVNDIMNHYPKDVQYAWSTSNYTSILQATEFLRKLDVINKQTSVKNSGNWPNLAQKPTIPASNQNDRKNAFNRNQQYNRPARQATSSKPVEANIVEIVGDNSTSHVQPVVNLNE